MSVRRRAVQERRDRDGTRRAEYEQTKRWLDNVRELVRKKLMFDDQRVSAEELAACFEDVERVTDTSDSLRITTTMADHSPDCAHYGDSHMPCTCGAEPDVIGVDAMHGINSTGEDR